MLGSNAILSDWDGQISVLEQQDLEILCNGNDEDLKNINQTNDRKQITNCSAGSANVHSDCSASRSSINRSVDSERFPCRNDCDSKPDSNRDQDRASPCSSVRYGSRYHPLIRGSSQIADSMVQIVEILQFQKLLERLNKHVSFPVSFFVVLDLTYATARFVYMFTGLDFRYLPLKCLLLNLTNIILWLVLGLLPFFMAASLTQACNFVRSNGHQIRTRPFVYHNTSSEDLNSMLIFSSTMDMSAKLFQMPIQSNYIYFALVITTVATLALGMCFSAAILGDIHI